MKVRILKRVYKTSSFVVFVWLIRFHSRETSNFEMAKSVASKKTLLRQGCEWRVLYCCTKLYQTYLRSASKIFINGL
jgi:hypothetical protein